RRREAMKRPGRDDAVAGEPAVAKDPERGHVRAVVGAAGAARLAGAARDVRVDDHALSRAEGARIAAALDDPPRVLVPEDASRRRPLAGPVLEDVQVGSADPGALHLD